MICHFVEANRPLKNRTFSKFSFLTNKNLKCEETVFKLSHRKSNFKWGRLSGKKWFVAILKQNRPAHFETAHYLDGATKISKDEILGQQLYTSYPRLFISSWYGQLVIWSYPYNIKMIMIKIRMRSWLQWSCSLENGDQIVTMIITIAVGIGSEVQWLQLIEDQDQIVTAMVKISVANIHYSSVSVRERRVELRTALIVAFTSKL